MEHLGTKPKFWFRNSESVWLLCKLARPNTGEDWSEKIAAEIAHSLNLPHAHYDLGLFEGNECILSPRCFPDDCTLVHGNELLRQLDPGYGLGTRFRETAHTLDAVWRALTKAPCDLPISWNPLPGIHSPADVFVGYLLLDALIGNTDRHHQNWGIVEAQDESSPRRYLAHTFDHASCLGCHLTDEARAQRLATKDGQFTPEAYAGRARSAFYPDVSAQKPMLTHEAFRRAAAAFPTAANIWRAKLQGLQPEQIDAILSSVPPHRFSKRSLDFTRRVLLHNRVRVLSMADEQ